MPPYLVGQVPSPPILCLPGSLADPLARSLVAIRCCIVLLIGCAACSARLPAYVALEKLLAACAMLHVHRVHVPCLHSQTKWPLFAQVDSYCCSQMESS